MCAVIRRVLIPLILASALAAGCNGSSSGSSSSGAVSSKETVRTAQTLPGQGTAKLPDGRVYTVAAPGQVLRLDDVTLHIDGLTWSPAPNSSSGSRRSTCSRGDLRPAATLMGVLPRATTTVSPGSAKLLRRAPK